MKRAKNEKLLGDYFDEGGNDMSIITTIKKLYGLAMSAVMDIKKIVEDYRSHRVGAISTGIMIFELSVVQFLLRSIENVKQSPFYFPPINLGNSEDHLHSQLTVGDRFPVNRNEDLQKKACLLSSFTDSG